MLVEMDLIKRKHRAERGLHDPRLVFFCEPLAKHINLQPYRFALGIDFLHSAGKVLAHHLDTLRPGTAKAKLNNTYLFLEWLAKHAGSFSAFHNRLKTDFKSINREDWEDMVHWWTSQLKGTPAKRMATIKLLNTVLDLWRDKGIIPQIAKPRVPKGARALQRPLKSIVEVDSKETNNKNSPASSIKELQENIRSDFAKHLSRSTLRAGNSNILSAIGGLTEKRLRILRRHSEKVLLEEYSIFNKGQSLIGKYCDPQMLRKDLESYFRIPPHSRQGVTILSDYDLKPCQKDATGIETGFKPCPRRLGNYLTYLEVFHNGIVIGLGHSEYRHGFHYWHRKDYGGLEGVQKFMYATHRAFCAAYTILCIDTGMNVCSIESLHHDCLQPTDDPDYWKIQTHKLRAKGRSIVELLPEQDEHRVSSVQAVRIIQEMTFRLRKNATSPEGQERLFIYDSKGRAGSPTEIRPWPADHFRESKYRPFIAECKQLQGLNITLSCIRPSVLMNKAMKSASLGQTQTLAHHTNLNTTYGYVNKYPFHLAKDLEIRKFLSLLEAISIKDMKDAAKKLGLNSKELKALTIEAQESGLESFDTRHLFKKSEIKASGASAKIANIFFVKNDLAMKELVELNRFLRDSQAKFKSSPDRYLTKFLPLFVLTEALIEKASQT